jgi:hypothetical protein
MVRNDFTTKDKIKIIYRAKMPEKMFFWCADERMFGCGRSHYENRCHHTGIQTVKETIYDH